MSNASVLSTLGIWARRMPLLLALLMAVAAALPATSALAAPNDTDFFCSRAVPGTPIPGPPSYAQHLVDATALMNAVINRIAALTSGTWSDPFHKIVARPEFIGAVNAAVVLYLAIYGILIMFNLTTISWYDAFIRLAKVGILYYLLLGSGMADIVAKFIFGGMNQLIDAYFDATVGASHSIPPLATIQNGLTTKPLGFLVAPLNAAFQMKFVMMVFGLFLGGFAGAGMMLFIIYGIFYFLLSLVGAVATYVKSMLGLYILFALSPIFIACLLFDQTKRLFDGWVSMVLSFALQPVFVFAFLGFFMLMITGVLQPLLDIDSCYGRVYDASFTELNWFFPVDLSHLSQYTHNADYNDIGLRNSDLWQKAGLQLKVIDVLMFVMLSTLAYRYNNYVQQVANEMVGGGVSITTTGSQIITQLKNNGLDPMSLTKRAFSTVTGTVGGVTEMTRQLGQMQGTMNQSKGIVQGQPPSSDPKSNA